MVRDIGNSQCNALRLRASVSAAFFVQHVVSSYDKHFAALNDKGDIPAEPSTSDEPVGKEASNLVVLLSELYNFQVISCVLMYDVIRALLDGDLTEFKVELLLKVTRSKHGLPSSYSE